MRRRGTAGAVRRLTRREWMAVSAAGIAGLGGTARAEAPPLGPDEQRARAEVLDRAKAVGIGGLKDRITDHFLALGDASDTFMAQAADICENLLADYLEYFQARKFPVHPPGRRLTVVVLAGPKELVQFLGDDDDPADAAPVYDPDANRLVFFDLRAGGISGRGARARGNTIQLCHEASFLVMYNTGLLDLDAEIPTCISDGLAAFLEFRPPTGRRAPGQPNLGKLDQLAGANHPAWFPVAQLLTDERLFEEGATFPLAEAESWALVDYLIRSPARLPGFVRYLEAINRRRDADHRLDDARTHLGDLEQLDKDLRAIADQWRRYYDRLPAAAKAPRG